MYFFAESAALIGDDALGRDAAGGSALRLELQLLDALRKLGGRNLPSMATRAVYLDKVRLEEEGSRFFCLPTHPIYRSCVSN